MEKTLDLSKPVQTEDGLKARVLCTDRKSKNYPVMALVENNGVEEPYKYTADGRFIVNERHTLDLVNVPEKKKWTGYINFYPHIYPQVHLSYEDAERNKADRREARVKVEIEYTVGQFDD